MTIQKLSKITNCFLILTFIGFSFHLEAGDVKNYKVQTIKLNHEVKVSLATIAKQALEYFYVKKLPVTLEGKKFVNKADLRAYIDVRVNKCFNYLYTYDDLKVDGILNKENEIVSFVVYRKNNDQGRPAVTIYGLFTDPDHKNKGMAKALVEYIESLSKDIFVFEQDMNYFYEKQGFENIDSSFFSKDKVLSSKGSGIQENGFKFYRKTAST